MRRFAGPFCLLALAALVGLFTLTDHSARASFSLTADGQAAISPYFKGEGGLYLLSLEMDPIKDRHETSCLFGGDLLPYPAPSGSVGMTYCDVAPAIFLGWKLYSDGRVVASEGPETTRDIERWAYSTQNGRRLERQLGIVQLVSSRTYQLAVRETGTPPLLAGTHPVIHVRRHVGDYGEQLDRIILGALLTLLLATAGFVWMAQARKRSRAPLGA
ncbi:MAG: hypothetical protein JWP50_3025 [Phenylobacterium sp.]|nr:hypothetical protein [Phenylobacterium sp.]